VIAVEVHQNALTSADIAWSMQLETITSGWHVDSFPTLNTSRNALTGEITIRWACGGVLQETPSLSNTGAIWNDVPGQANNSYTFTPTPGTQRFFSLRQ